MLVAIVGNAEIAAGMLAGHPARELLDEIQMAAGRASGLTRQLLAFSRGQPLERRDVDLGAVVSGFAPVLRKLLPPGIELEISSTAGLGVVRGDPGQLEQVVMNLVVNARDALPEGGRILVEVEAVSLDASFAEAHPPARAGEYALLSVTDTGVGMAPEVVERLFEPFFTTKQAGAGTGLGLAVVESVVRRHGGFVDVYSEKERGTTFRVYLPLSAHRADAAAPPLAEEPATGGSEHVLVVDDDAQIRALLERVLGAAGYRVSVAEDGQAALEALDALGDVDLVIADLVMPRMGGDALREAVLARPRPVPVLLMTGYARGAAAQGRFEHLISKPFAPRALLARLREILDS